MTYKITETLLTLSVAPGLRHEQIQGCEFARFVNFIIRDDYNKTERMKLKWQLSTSIQ